MKDNSVNQNLRQLNLVEGKFPFYYEFGRARFLSQATVGDLIRTEAILTRHNRRLIEGYGRAFVGDKVNFILSGIGGLCLSFYF